MAGHGRSLLGDINAENLYICPPKSQGVDLKPIVSVVMLVSGGIPPCTVVTAYQEMEQGEEKREREGCI